MTAPSAATRPPRSRRGWVVTSWVVCGLIVIALVWFLAVPRLFPRTGQDGLIGEAHAIADEVDGVDVRVDEDGPTTVHFSIVGPRGQAMVQKLDDLSAVLDDRGWTTVRAPDWTDTEFHEHRTKLIDGRLVWLLARSSAIPTPADELPEEATVTVSVSFEGF